MTAHPLDPLTAEEIAAAAAAIKSHGGLDDSAWIETISLNEPSKAALAAGTAERQAYICSYEPSSNCTFNGIVRLADGSLEDWGHVPGVQARIVPDEFAAVDELIRAHPEFQAACRARGIEDMSNMLVESWGAGHFGIEDEEGRRLAYCHCWVGNEAGDNPYARPIANLHPVVDLATYELIRIEDFGAVPLPPDPGPMNRTEHLRDDVKPLDIIQPEGPSFEVDGFKVRWQNWHVRIGYDLREALVLHEIGYEHGGEIRPIIHRASMAEMVVPYGDPRGGNFRRNAFDTGEYGLGQAVDSLALGCDCLGHIHYFDVSSHDWQGAPRLIKNAVCMHEEDYGILWKFQNGRAGTSRVVRSRRLVISSLCTIGNYIYGFYWYFYQDGTIGVEVKATGIPFPSAIAPGESSPYGAVVGPGIESHVHQHVFSFRFDMAVDGPNNAVREVNFEPAPVSEHNPHAAAINIVETKLKTETSAQRTLDMSRARYWKIVNPEKHNAYGKNTAYKLSPGNNSLPILPADSPTGKRGAFMYKHFWATQFAATEKYPAGMYPNQDPGSDGLAEWTKADRSLEGEDVVVWYTLNFHHLPRPEDYPVQPVVYADFHWMPDGFFDENPAMDVPPGKR
ncbi:MAG: primary-amine oxidase [Alphaproteobacteria bacterium]|nr:primary-amine oxidase [Alphaproteobacteria bacterium]